MKKVVYLKSWQLFLLLMIPFIAQYFLFLMPFPFGIYLSSFLTEISAFIVFTWLYSIGVILYSKLQLPKGFNIRFFKFSLIYALTYIIVYSIVSSFSRELFLQVIPFLSIFHLFSMVCTFYSVYFISKLLVTLEMNREVRLSEYLRTLFLLYCFPIGIWFIQSRIRKVIM